MLLLLGALLRELVHLLLLLLLLQRAQLAWGGTRGRAASARCAGAACVCPGKAGAVPRSAAAAARPGARAHLRNLVRRQRRVVRLDLRVAGGSVSAGGACASRSAALRKWERWFRVGTTLCCAPAPLRVARARRGGPLRCCARGVPARSAGPWRSAAAARAPVVCDTRARHAPRRQQPSASAQPQRTRRIYTRCCHRRDSPAAGAAQARALAASAPRPLTHRRRHHGARQQRQQQQRREARHDGDVQTRGALQGSERWRGPRPVVRLRPVYNP
jgi:hypothetical protein